MLGQAIIIAGTLAALLYAGRFLEAPAGTPAKSDLIVSLGGDGGSRVLTVADLYASGFAPRILLTGIDSGDAGARAAFLEWRVALLAERGVPRSALLLDSTASNSWEEGRNVRQLMEREGWRGVLVVSDPPHLRRLSWVWSRAFEGSGIEFRLIPSALPSWDACNWWRDEKSAQFVLMELVKLVYYGLRY